jgi:NADPH:quinone reductase-like Zn-dependent oxidoreductase
MADDEVLVEVCASSVNPADRYIMMGLPWLVRLVEGLRRPHHAILGQDYAGVVRAVGKSVDRFAVGDAVYGQTTSTWAELVSVKQTRVFRKPSNVSFAEAACVPLAGVTALQALKKVPTVKGKRVLVIGASGGVGLFAVQIAASLGAHVVGVCGAGNLDTVKALGVSQVERYDDPHLNQLIAPCDVIVDTVSTRSFAQLLPWLSADGTYVMVGSPMNMKLRGVRLAGPLGAYLKLKLTRKHGRHLALLTARSNAGIDELSALLQDGKLKVVISKSFRLHEAKDALAYLDSRRPAGKVALVIDARN